ncbi:MAG: c-type cytochrome [Janthinobacterium lividum]
MARTREDFDRALRHGIAKQGYSLYHAGQGAAAWHRPRQWRDDFSGQLRGLASHDRPGSCADLSTRALNATVNSNNPMSMIHIVLHGAETPATMAAPTRYAMPGFALRLDDREIADVLSFIRSSWAIMPRL